MNIKKYLKSPPRLWVGTFFKRFVQQKTWPESLGPSDEPTKGPGPTRPRNPNHRTVRLPENPRAPLGFRLRDPVVFVGLDPSHPKRYQKMLEGVCNWSSKSRDVWLQSNNSQNKMFFKKIARNQEVSFLNASLRLSQKGRKHKQHPSSLDLVHYKYFNNFNICTLMYNHLRSQCVMSKKIGFQPMKQPIFKVTTPHPETATHHLELPSNIVNKAVVPRLHLICQKAGIHAGLQRLEGNKKIDRFELWICRFWWSPQQKHRPGPSRTQKILNSWPWEKEDTNRKWKWNSHPECRIRILWLNTFTIESKNVGS